MLTTKQTRLEYLCNIFLDSDCCGCLFVTGIVIVFLLWLEMNLILVEKQYFKTEALVMIMMMEVGIMSFFILLVWFIYDIIQSKNQNESWIQTFLKSYLFQTCTFLFVCFCILLMLYAVYLGNFQIIAHYYYFQNSTNNLNEISKRACHWTMIELIFIPFLVAIAFGAIFLICSTAENLYEGSKAYDKNVLLTQQKQDV